MKSLKKKTDKSHVEEFGSADSLRDRIVGDFEGSLDTLLVPSLRSPSSAVTARKLSGSSDTVSRTSVDSRDAGLVSLFYTYLDSGKDVDAKELITEIEHRQASDYIFREIARKVMGALDLFDEGVYHAPRSFDCHKRVNEAVAKSCGGYSDYSMKYIRVMVNMCEHLGGDHARIVNAVEEIC